MQKFWGWFPLTHPGLRVCCANIYVSLILWRGPLRTKTILGLQGRSVRFNYAHGLLRNWLDRAKKAGYLNVIPYRRNSLTSDLA
jgi:hypothetical protein